MASERQIAANRRNAQNSAGPRSGAGKKRASRNSYRHGLTAKMVQSAELDERIEYLARTMAGDAADATILNLARAAAQAELDLVRIRQVQVALVRRLSAFGTFDGPRMPCKGVRGETDFVVTFGENNMFPTTDDAAAMPQTEAGRTAEAVRRALPDLIKLDRYERRAAAQRERSLSLISSRGDYIHNQK